MSPWYAIENVVSIAVFQHLLLYTCFVIIAHLKGVIDPTGKLPKNQVFISGYTTNVNKERVLFGKAHSKVFLSRSPCLEPTDAKLLNVVGSKPREMSTDDWNMLCSYGYGTIIFPQSRSVPLANVIAGKKLSDYMCCYHWQLATYILILIVCSSWIIRWRPRWRW